MKVSPWLQLISIALATVMACVAVSAQAPDDPAQEPTEARESGYDEVGSILATVADYGTLRSLLNLVYQAGLDTVLTGPGPVTLLAPDDSAFARLPAERMERLKSDKEFLKKVLRHHIIAGRRVEFGDGPQTVPLVTLSGDTLVADVNDYRVEVDSALVIDEQVDCSNGVIHVIDAVLLPLKERRKG